ncbi:hypothetical protein ACVJF1_007404 [Bradyrhizobium diazoefficiens]
MRCKCIASRASKDERPGCSRAVALRGSPCDTSQDEHLRVTVINWCSRPVGVSQSQTHLRILAACFARALLHRDTLRCQRAQGRPGAGQAPTVHCAKGGYEKSAQRHTGEAQHTAFPAQWFDGLCRVLPGERCTIAPVALRIADVRARSGRRITARLGAQTPGARTTRFCRTQITPVVCATAFAHGCPPCDALAPM